MQTTDDENHIFTKAELTHATKVGTSTTLGTRAIELMTWAPP